MPTIIGQETGPHFTGRPRHMSTEDSDIWYRFKERALIQPTRLLFDVGVGDGKPAPGHTEPKWRDFWLRETQRRIDVLAIEPARQIIIELRKHALANALGRLLVYRHLLAQDPIERTPVETWIVTDTHDPELAAFFAQHQIRWITV